MVFTLKLQTPWGRWRQQKARLMAENNTRKNTEYLQVQQRFADQLRATKGILEQLPELFESGGFVTWPCHNVTRHAITWIAIIGDLAGTDGEELASTLVPGGKVPWETHIARMETFCTHLSKLNSIVQEIIQMAMCFMDHPEARYTGIWDAQKHQVWASLTYLQQTELVDSVDDTLASVGKSLEMEIGTAYLQAVKLKYTGLADGRLSQSEHIQH